MPDAEPTYTAFTHWADTDPTSLRADACNVFIKQLQRPVD